MRAEDVFRFVVAVDVGGDEIDRNVLLFGVGEKFIGPTRLRGGGTADAEDAG